MVGCTDVEWVVKRNLKEEKLVGLMYSEEIQDLNESKMRWSYTLEIYFPGNRELKNFSGKEESNRFNFRF